MSSVLNGAQQLARTVTSSTYGSSSEAASVWVQGYNSWIGSLRLRAPSVGILPPPASTPDPSWLTSQMTLGSTSPAETSAHQVLTQAFDDSSKRGTERALATALSLMMNAALSTILGEYIGMCQFTPSNPRISMPDNNNSAEGSRQAMASEFASWMRDSSIVTVQLIKAAYIVPPQSSAPIKVLEI